ncbi:MAG: uroporphyrinogen decarboxylase family protein [bacterium]
MEFQPDYRHFTNVMLNKRPVRLPLYEHIVNAASMEKILGLRFAELEGGNAKDKAEYFHQHCRFFRQMTYDTVSYEVCIGATLPGKMAICGGQGPIQSRSDFNAYPWNELPLLYWRYARPRLDALVAALPSGMKAVGGVGNGVFELAESLVGMEYLPFMEVDDPDLYADLFRAIGDLMCAIWEEFMPRYGTYFAACRFGDDLGFKSSLLTNPATVRGHILPQYRRVIDIVHSGNGLFLWHSCGCIFEIMDDVIALGIDAKHSNEDSIAPFDRWITAYGDRIGLLGGFDMDFLCGNTPDVIYDKVREAGRRFRKSSQGYALGSGNSIPAYVPTDNYLAMIRAAQDLRQEEST